MSISILWNTFNRLFLSGRMFVRVIDTVRMLGGEVGGGGGREGAEDVPIHHA